MKHGIFEALARAAAGEMPTPESTSPLATFRDQLEASVAARENPSTPSVRTVPTVRPQESSAKQQMRQGLRNSIAEATPARVEPGLGGRARAARQVPRGSRPVGHGQTIEAALGEDEAAPVVADARSSDDGGSLSDSPSAGYRRVSVEEFARVSRGEAVAQLDVVEAEEDRVEAALLAEAAGAQTLPLEPLPQSSTFAEVDSTVEEVGDEALTTGSAAVEPCSGDASAAAPTLTYDLPTDIRQLPRFCFVCGPAGCGKTFMAKAWAHGDPGVTLAATTGIAAVNLGEGTTINSLLKFFNTASLTDAFTGGWLESQFVRLRRAGLHTIVLDEVSMLDGDQLTVLVRAIDNVNASRTGDDEELGLVLVGDFAQLPPVKAPFAFESAEWGRFAEATYALTTIRRQADLDFVKALQAVRRGDADTALQFFGDHFESVTQQAFDGTTILAKNDQVERYNQLRLDKVQGEPLQFDSQRWGKLRPEWGGAPKPPAEWGVPEKLKLKIGATVMILANRNVAGKDEPPLFAYVNGDCGTVTASANGTATVELTRTGTPVVVYPIERTNVIPLEPGRRKQLTAEGHPERVDGKHEVIGAITYMPLRLAYATTVHKSQGLSLDAVQINIRDHFFSEPGMLYVALSRARTVEGLRLVGTPEGFRARCRTSPKVQPWL